MSFFASRKTECSICHQVIDYRYGAALLPYVHPSISASLAELGRTYVHRKCWEDWESAEMFSSAAYNLVRTGIASNSPITVEFAKENSIIFWVPALRSYRLQDFSLLTIIDLSLNDFPDFVNFLTSAVSEQNFDSSYSGETYDWEVKQEGFDTRLSSSQDHEVIESFLIPHKRKMLWLDALKFVNEGAKRFMIAAV